MPTIHQVNGPHNGPPIKLHPMAKVCNLKGDPRSSSEISIVPAEQKTGGATIKFLPMSEVTIRTGFKKSFLYESIKQSLFPPNVRIGFRSARFLESEVFAVQRAWARGAGQDEIKQLVADLVALRKI